MGTAGKAYGVIQILGQQWYKHSNIMKLVRLLPLGSVPQMHVAL